MYINLYALYINDIGVCCHKHRYLLYADDTLIHTVHQHICVVLGRAYGMNFCNSMEGLMVTS